MNKLIVAVVTIVALMTPVTQAGLQSKIGELLGIAESPSEALVTSRVVSAASEPTTFLTVWGLSTPEADSPDNTFVLRAGAQLDDVEICLESVYQGVHGDTQSYGVFVAMHILGEPGALGAPYIAFHATIIDAEDGGFYGPIAGTKYPLGKNLEAIVEGWYRDFTGAQKRSAEQNDEFLAFAGLRLKF